MRRFKTEDYNRVDEQAQKTKEKLIQELRRIRLERKITQTEMADNLQLERKTINRTEMNCDCNISTFVKMAEYLGFEIVLKERE